jgi:hypothetical protein
MSAPVSVPWNTKAPLNIGSGLVLIWSRWNSPPILMVCLPTILE